MFFTGWEVRVGRNCARGLVLFFSYRDLKVSGKFSFTLQPMCVEVGRVRVDEARDRLQTKTKHYNLIFSSVSLRTAEVFPRSSPLRVSRGATSAVRRL